MKQFKVKTIKEVELTAEQLKKLKLIRGNRPIYVIENGEEKITDTLNLKKGVKFSKKGRIGDIIKCIYDKETHTWNQRNPVEVNARTNRIGNGQGRSVGFILKVEDGGLDKDATIPVRFVDVPEDCELEWMEDTNTCQHDWTCNDSVESQIALGNKNFIKLRDWALTQPELCVHSNGSIKYRTAANILAGGRKEHEFKTKNYKFPEENISLGDTMCSEMISILDCMPTWTVGKANIEAMAKEWKRVRTKFNLSDWLYGVSMCPDGPIGMGIRSAGSWKDYFTLVGGKLAMSGILPNITETEPISKRKMDTAKKKAAAATAKR